jgi:hypothetical protein
MLHPIISCCFRTGTTVTDFESKDWKEGDETNQPVSAQVRCVSAAHVAELLGRVDVLVIDAEVSDLVVLESVFDWANAINVAEQQKQRDKDVKEQVRFF